MERVRINSCDLCLNDISLNPNIPQAVYHPQFLHFPTILGRSESLRILHNECFSRWMFENHPGGVYCGHYACETEHQLSSFSGHGSWRLRIASAQNPRGPPPPPNFPPQPPAHAHMLQQALEQAPNGPQQAQYPQPANTPPPPVNLDNLPSVMNNNRVSAPPPLPIPFPGPWGALGLHYLPRARKNALNVVYIEPDSAEMPTGVIYNEPDSDEMPSGSKRADCSSDENKEESNAKKSKKTEDDNRKAAPGFKRTKKDKN